MSHTKQDNILIRQQWPNIPFQRQRSTWIICPSTTLNLNLMHINSRPSSWQTPENEDNFQLAALQLVEQNRRAAQHDTILLSNEHYEELDGVTQGQCPIS